MDPTGLDLMQSSSARKKSSTFLGGKCIRAEKTKSNKNKSSTFFCTFGGFRFWYFHRRRILEIRPFWFTVFPQGWDIPLISGQSLMLERWLFLGGVGNFSGPKMQGIQGFLGLVFLKGCLIKSYQNPYFIWGRYVGGGGWWLAIMIHLFCWVATATYKYF